MSYQTMLIEQRLGRAAYCLEAARDLPRSTQRMQMLEAARDWTAAAARAQQGDISPYGTSGIQMHDLFREPPAAGRTPPQQAPQHTSPSGASTVHHLEAAPLALGFA